MTDQPVDEHDVQIIQLVAATDEWTALFEDGANMSVACFALMECATHGNRYIAPIVSDGGELLDATQIDDYVGVLHVEDLESERHGDNPDGDDEPSTH